jgi:hypothetical protein
MKFFSIHSPFCCKIAVLAFCMAAPGVHAQTSPARARAASNAHSADHLRSRLFIYDLRDGSSRLVYSADSIWEAPNWSPDGKYLIANSGGGIYKLVLSSWSSLRQLGIYIAAAVSRMQLTSESRLTPKAIDIAAKAWANREPHASRLTCPQQVQRRFRVIVTDWFRFLGRLDEPPILEGPHHSVLQNFARFLGDERYSTLMSWLVSLPLCPVLVKSDLFRKIQHGFSFCCCMASTPIPT